MDKSKFKVDKRRETLFGIAAISIDFIALALLGLGIYFSAFKSPEPFTIGFMEFFSIMLTLIALVFSVLGELKKEAYHVTAHLALIISVGLLAFHTVLLSKGF